MKSILIKAADWIIDLGPKGGDQGGYIIAEGAPEAVAQMEGSYTGQFLRRVLALGSEAVEFSVAQAVPAD